MGHASSLITSGSRHVTLTIGFKTHVGIVRNSNQDSYAVLRRAGFSMRLRWDLRRAEIRETLGQGASFTEGFHRSIGATRRLKQHAGGQ